MSQTSLFHVYLRLRPPMSTRSSDQWLLVEPPANNETEEAEEIQHSTHIMLQPPNDSRKRAIERFGFTKVFQENASQLELFQETGAADNIVKSVLQNGRDGLIATLGVTGSGKSFTILGSKSQRGMTQMSLDVLFRSIGQNIRHTDSDLLTSLQASDASEAHFLSASSFLDSTYDNGDRARLSRAQTPMSRGQTPMVRFTLDDQELPSSFPIFPPSFDREPWHPPSKVPFWQRLSPRKKEALTKPPPMQEPSYTRKLPLPNLSNLPTHPDVSSHIIEVDPSDSYAIIVSLYEVYNDRIFDLLSTQTSGTPLMSTRAGAALQKGLTRRPLLFKNTEGSLDRKVVAGLRKVVCSTYEEAMLVLEAGLTERRVAGTGSNSVSSRSHGFFCIEVKKSTPSRCAHEAWTGGTLSIVDLAGSERARNAKTTGSTLAEAGKINESLMYLGQCLQVQSDCQQDGSKPIVPFRQCKLTELLFTNSFTATRPQKAIMIVTADPQGDFNATSQILRYSALAREVTVPRIPSVQSHIAGQGKHGYPTPLNSGRTSPNDAEYLMKELDQATHEVERLSEECNILSVKLAEEEILRSEAELRARAVEEKVQMVEERMEEAEARAREEVEMEVREEVWKEMENMMEKERNRWRQAWEEERARAEERMDEKVEILGRKRG